MIFLMILIEELVFQENIMKFYRGINFDKLMRHSKEGKDGFIFCFIDNWKREVNQYDRSKKINSILEDDEYSKFEWNSIDNNFICIYQTEGIGYDVVYNTIKNKILNNQLPDKPWIPINGIDKGAWKIK